MQIYVGVKERAASLRPTCRCHEYLILVSLLLHIWCTISTACCMKISGWGLVADIRSREKGRYSPFSTKHKRWPTNLAKHRRRLLHVKEAIKVWAVFSVSMTVSITNSYMGWRWIKQFLWWYISGHTHYYARAKQKLCFSHNYGTVHLYRISQLAEIYVF